MGKKSKRRRNKKHLDLQDAEFPTAQFQDAKLLSKSARKKNKRLLQKMSKANASSSGNCELDWCKVSVSSKSSIAKKFLFESIMPYVTPFRPYGFITQPHHTVVFYLEKPGNLDRLLCLTNRLQNEDGSTLSFKVHYVSEPDVAPNAIQLERIRSIIARRYVAETGLLDLTNFHRDPGLIEHDVFAPICSTVVGEQVRKLIVSNCPAISAINLSENSLDDFSLAKWKPVIEKYMIKAICLNFNNIKKATSLVCLSAPYITELNLVGNPVIESVDLKNIISSHFPAISSSLTVKQNVDPGEERVNTYIRQYYEAFDSSNRSHLRFAYVEDIKFEFISKEVSIPSLNCTNLAEMEYFLNQFPPTSHAFDTFKVSILHSKPDIAVQVEGICKIGEHSFKFTNKMILLSKNGGFCCSIQMVEISPL